MICDREQAARLVIEAGKRLSATGLIERTWGNISARISDTQFVITPSGMAYDRLTPEDIVTVNIADCSYEGSVKPSSEKGIHADAYRLRPDVDFVIHTHQLYGTAYGVVGRPLRLRDEVLGEFVPNAAYGISSTKTLRRNVAAVVGDCPKARAVFMRGHGVLCLGTDCEDCFRIAERLETVCEQKVRDCVPVETPKYPTVEITPELSEYTGDAALLSVNTPSVLALSHTRDKKRPVIDDMAQIAGTDYACVTVKAGWEKLAARALRERSIVFIRHRGAICKGTSMDEAEAVAGVAEKNCLSALYAQSQRLSCPISYPDALLQRSVYKLKYSKMK